MAFVLRSPGLDLRIFEFSGSDLYGGLNAPSEKCMEIGALYPIPLWGRSSL